MHRRRLLQALGSLSLGGATAGCLGSSATETTATPSPTPVDLSGGKRDDQGGMVIGNHGGPNGQIFYESHSPEGHANPAWFHTLSFGLFPYYFEKRRRGWTTVAIYATDYSTVEYDLTTVRDRTYISAPTAPETFENARELEYVAGSEVLGGMGPALVPFSAESDAQAFVTSHGGRVLSFDDVTADFLRDYTN
jgi:nitrous oxide reductase accessory protein NosL